MRHTVSRWWATGPCAPGKVTVQVTPRPASEEPVSVVWAGAFQSDSDSASQVTSTDVLEHSHACACSHTHLHTHVHTHTPDVFYDVEKRWIKIHADEWNVHEGEAALRKQFPSSGQERVEGYLFPGKCGALSHNLRHILHFLFSCASWAKLF